MASFMNGVLALAVVGLFIFGISLANSASNVDELMNEKKRLQNKD